MEKCQPRQVSLFHCVQIKVIRVCCTDIILWTTGK